MYPIRLIGEVKYYNRLVGKDTVRQFVGVLRDIQENYIVPVELEEEKKTRLPKLPCRYIEVGTIFAAKEFTRTAELLAYAQGIKTISYKNNLMVNSIKEVIDRLEIKIPYETFKSNEVSILQYINDCFDSYDDKTKIGKTSRLDSFVTDSSLDGDGIDSDINGKKGDMYIIVNVIIPSKLSKKQKDLFKELSLTDLDNDSEFTKYTKKLK